MAQIKKKFIESNAVDGTKIRLSNDEFLRGRNAADSGDIDIVKVNAADDLELGADLDAGGFEIINAASPTTPDSLVTKSYVDAQLEGLKPKTSVRAASTADVDISSELEDGDVLDGVTLATGDRVLLKDQTAPEENGIYVVVASGAASRSTDFDSLTPIDEINGAYVPVQEGTANEGKFFVQTGLVAVLNTDPIVFTYFNSAVVYVGGDGIDITGNTISVDHDGEGLTFVANQLALELDGGTLSKSATGLKVANAGIGTTQLANDSVDKDKINADVAGNGLAQNVDGSLEVKLEATNPSLQIVADELGVKFSATTSALQKGASGLSVKLEASNPTLQIDGSNQLGAKLNGSGGLETSASGIQINVDATNGTTKINASNELESLKAFSDLLTLNGTDITNQYKDLTKTAHSAASIHLIVDGGLTQLRGVDYTVSLAGGAGGVTRITFAGDLATAGAAELVSGDILEIYYNYL